MKTRKKKRNKMQQTAIDWVRNPDGTKGQSWNPIRGRCPVKCKLPNGDIYCYGHKYYDRFPWLDYGCDLHGALIESELEKPIKRKKPARIFVCSTHELFFKKEDWARDEIFKTIDRAPQHTFIILTKFPKNIDRWMPENVWLGVSITSPGDLGKFDHLNRAHAKIKFASFEPLLNGPVRFPSFLDWAIAGRLKYHGNIYQPKREWIERLVETAARFRKPIFLKDNLRKIWRDDLIQEWPK